jgi:transposase-like protein
MQVHHVGYRIRGFYRVAALGHLGEMTPKDAQRRLQILRFWERYGLQATRDAFGVSRRTLYRWKKALRDQGGNPAALAARPSAPKRRRTPKTDPRLVAEIRRWRTLYPRQREAACPACPLVPKEGHSAALGLHDRPHHCPCPGQNAPCANQADTRDRHRPLKRHPKPRKPKGLRHSP